jgi:hypothetical protein
VYENKPVTFPKYLTKAVSRNPDFFGQEDVLRQMDEVLLPEPTDPEKTTGTFQPRGLRSFALCGMGGIGKTELAIEYIFSRQRKFDAIFWVYADTMRKLATTFVDIAWELGLTGASKGNTDEKAAREAVMDWFSNPLGRLDNNTATDDTVEAKWLLVFDNADDPDILYDWWPTKGVGSVLVTSRDPLAKDGFYPLSVGIDMKPFTPEEAGTLLQKLSRRENEANGRDSCIRIAAILGGVPLAITQMSGIIRRRHLSLGEFEEYYRDNAKRLHEMRISMGQTSYGHTISTVWAVEQLPKAAAALLKVLSLLDPDRIPEDLLTEGARYVPLEDYPLKKSAYYDARAELLRSSLITRNMETNELRIHRLVQEVVREKMGDEELRIVFESTGVLLTAVWPFVSGTDPTRNQAWRWPICEKYAPHISMLEKLFGPAIRSGDFDGDVKSGGLFSSLSW